MQKVGSLLGCVQDNATQTSAFLHLSVTRMDFASVPRGATDQPVQDNAHVTELALRAATMVVTEQVSAHAKLATVTCSAMKRSSGAMVHGVLVMVSVGSQTESRKGLLRANGLLEEE